MVPVGVNRPEDDRDVERAEVDPLKYQAQPRVDRTAVRPGPTVAANNGEWLTVKTRYKQPESDQSELITHAVRAGGRVQHLPLATAVAEFGLILRDAPRNIQRWDALERRAARLTAPASLAADLDGFRELVATARGLARLR